MKPEEILSEFIKIEVPSQAEIDSLQKSDYNKKLETDRKR